MKTKPGGGNGAMSGKHEKDLTRRAEFQRHQSGVLSVDTVERLVADPVLLARYEQSWDGRLYAAILAALTNKLFPECRARRLWEGILRHLQTLCGLLERNPGIEVAALDYLWNVETVLAEPQIIEEDTSRSMIDSATHDGLTGLYGHNVFDVMMYKEMERSNRDGKPLSMLMIDVDDFKKVNDCFGHPKGDRVLRSVGHVIGKAVRQMDLAVRYGGDELAVIMPGADEIQARLVAQRISRGIEATHPAKLQVTVSIGIGCRSRQTASPAKLFAATDKALYRAKRGGKNRIEVC